MLFRSSEAKDQRHPSVGSYIARVKGPNQPGLPAYVGLPSAQSVYLFPGYQGAAYLGQAFNPFDANTRQRYMSASDGSKIEPPPVLNELGGNPARIHERVNLLTRLDQFRRDADSSRSMDALDRYQQQAIDFVLGERARNAFDIEKEKPAIRDRYGRGPWGHYTLLARRLVESGVSFVTVDMPHWDDHADIERGHGYKLPVFDKAVGALMTDLSERGLLNDVIVVAMGEFGRTPKINQGLPGNTIPGRDHWGEAFSAMVAGEIGRAHV